MSKAFTILTLTIVLLAGTMTAPTFAKESKVQSTGRMHMSMTTSRATGFLTELVRKGDITEAQKTAILAELTALRAKYHIDTLSTMTATERKAALQGMKTEFATWANNNGIQLSLLLPGKGKHVGQLKHMGMATMNSFRSAQTTQ